MKKALNISIANTLFYIEEDAYQKLDAYLKSVREHFATYPDKDEIVSDIESRIAEQFTASGKKVITIAEVEALVATMGNASDFGDEPETSGAPEAKPKKRLFRNPDDSIIAGVCSGIAAYLDIDPTIVRLVFVASVLFGGTGVIVYVILWIVVPEAATTTEKLQMRGDAVTLESVSEMVKEKASEIKEKANRGNLRKIASLFGQGASRFVDFLSRRLFPIIGKIVGVFVVALAFIGIVALSIALISILFGLPDNVDFPLRSAMGSALYNATALAGYGAIVIPVLFILLLGVSMVRRASAFGGKAVGFTFLSIWFVSLISLGAAMTKTASIQTDIMQTDPSFQMATRAYEVVPFARIEVRNGQRVKFVYATTTSLTADGRQRDIDQLSIESKDGVLSIGVKDDSRICIFCWHEPVTITVAVPMLDSVALANSSRATGDVRGAARFDLRNGSRADLSLVATTTFVTLANSSRANLSGTSTALVADLANGSRLDATRLSVDAATITVQNGGRADVNVATKLTANAYNGSRIFYYGSPEVEENSRNGSKIEPYANIKWAEPPSPPSFEAEI